MVNVGKDQAIGTAKERFDQPGMLGLSSKTKVLHETCNEIRQKPDIRITVICQVTHGGWGMGCRGGRILTFLVKSAVDNVKHLIAAPS